MCGISAVFAYHPAGPPVDRPEVEAMTRQMFARGPDAGGTWYSEDGRVGLGSRRLAIIDLTAEGTQPMHDIDGDLVIVFNGEIYNYRELRSRLEGRGHRFHSTSDTEVLLQMYRRHGERMLPLLRGMFGFAIYDRRQRRMFVARDPYGIKPLYFADDGKTFRAASQVKALLAGGAISRSIDPAGAAGFFLLGTVPEPFTIHESIRAVEAGSGLYVGERGPEPARRYYSIAQVFSEAEPHRNIARLVPPATLLREFVTESVDYHLVSDVPVGAFLSAGIDSTSLVALAQKRTAEPLRTVTVLFDALRGTDADEAADAAAFARERGAAHTTRVVTREEFLADLPRIFAAMDQPTIDGVNTWFVSKAAAEQGLKVALSGVGGDELFGSYPAFRRVPRLVRAASALQRLPLGPQALRGGVAVMRRTAARRNPKTEAIPRYAGTYAGAYLLQRGLYMPEELPAVLPRDLAEEGLRRLAPLERIGAAIDRPLHSTFSRVASLEASLYMRNQLLRDTDWASMAHSLEVRTPLVDAFLLRQIAPLLLEYGSQCKQFFAASPDPPLPQSIAARRKTGFGTPIRSWMGLPDDGTSTGMRSWAQVVFEQFP
jgi:asparagine synthase (glutamine-hydrolysing)